MNVLFWLILFIVTYIALITTMLFVERYKRWKEKYQDMEIDKMTEKFNEAYEEEKQKHLMDEGFENIMSYEVNGKNGFEN